LGVPRLRRRFRCTAREAAGLAELFLALDAGADVVAHYEREARCCPVAGIIEDLVHLVAQLALAQECPEADALSDAECLGESADAVSEDGYVAWAPGQSDGAPLAWHAVGIVQPEVVNCPGCGVAYEADDECLEIPTCPGCATPNTWEARQGPVFRQLVGAIDGCAALAELAALGKRLYALALPHDQAGVAWSHYQLRKAALEAAVTLSAEAQGLLARVEQASERQLPRVGAELYRLQRAGALALAGSEWRRIWRAYSARRRRRVA
jgi:hypothetical protein